jgi:hypothetical protein
MKRIKYKFFVLMSVWLAIFLTQNYVMVMMHERVHQNIYNAYGVNSTIEVSYLGGMTCPTGGEVSREDYRAMETSHNINDTFGYHLTMPLSFISATLFVLLFERIVP